jgi:hypothetical protein
MSYRVLNQTFSSFDEVYIWAWDVLKISANGWVNPPTSEEEKQEACKELERLITGIEE